MVSEKNLDFNDFKKQDLKFDVAKLQEAYNQIKYIDMSLENIKIIQMMNLNILKKY